MARPRLRRKIPLARSRYALQVVTIELYGLPRVRAGRQAVQVEAASVGEALRALAVTCPGLGEEVLGADGGPTAGYLVAIDGRDFTRDATTALSDGDVLVLISSQAGG